MYQFRDPIHGFIEVSEQELKIINSAPFQRLRNIRQLATTYLVYHGAEHTRFGHSLGVMHLTSRVFDSIVQKNPLLFSDDVEQNEKKIDFYRQILRLIGLTHDLGHAPFSHASEKLFDKSRKHEDYTKEILFNTEISEYINEIGNIYKEKYGDDYEITPELIWMIYDGKDVTNEKFIMPDFLFLKSFMDGELDCDKMDYLLRDSHYCGVTYGTYDLNRFVSTLTVYKDTKYNTLQIAIERGGIQALEEFILARYFMFIQVYFHKTRRFLDKTLVDSLSELLPNGKYPTDINEYLTWTDTKVLSLISNSESNTVQLFKSRIVKTCVYETTAHANKSDNSKFRIILKLLTNEYGDKIVSDSVDKEAHKLLPTLLSSKDDSGKGIMIIDDATKEVTNIMDESIILGSIVQPISIKRIYAEKSISQKVIEKIKELQMD
ncbi:MAG: HD domain-containing protein [Clostridia bacterium]|nr:HD domain-containing protein [Clostridia bacterium]